MDDEFLQYGDEYDDEDYGSQSQGQGFYYEDPNAGMIDGSGRSYDDEDITDESGKLINKVLAQQQLQAAKMAQGKKPAMGQMGKPGFMSGASAGGFGAG